MSKVKIQTLTPIHIGSGNFLKNNSDFVEYKEGEDSYLSVIDPKKILDLIGLERINDWISVIERQGDTKDFMTRMCRNAHPRSYSLRTITNFASVRREDTLKECLHDGMGKPYIPGSSIKGAIRTAVVATLAAQMHALENLVVVRRNEKKNVTAKQVEAKMFGGDPNSDVFRFVKVGDAYFEKGSELSTRVINLNIRKRDSLIDSSKPQLVEAIGVDFETECQMKVDKAYYDWAKDHWPADSMKVKPLGVLGSQMANMASLFSLVNAHTCRLVEDEIEYWKGVKKSGFSDADNYIKNMQQIMKEIEACQEGKECVLRLGHASGWRFITGAWTENLDNFKSEIVPASRPKNFNYEQYVFPKSRRLDEDGDIFGFVKLELL